MTSHWTLRPAWSRWRRYLLIGLALDLLFAAAYGGAGALAGGQAVRLRLFTEWELSIPFVPQFIWAYLSLLLLFLLPPFALSPAALSRLGGRLALATLIAAACFLLLPTEPGFPRHPEASGLFRLLYALDPPHNLLPSLHVTYATMVILALLPPSPRWARGLLLAWLSLLCVSTVLVHQHHLADVAAGCALALVLGRGEARARQPSL